MRIKILVPLVTMTRAYEKGETVDWPDADDAARLVKAGYAEPSPSAAPNRK